jgi:hypothetical protein
LPIILILFLTSCSISQGEFLAAVHQHSTLPAHVHFIVVAKGYRPLITLVYPRPDDPYLQDNPGFVTKPELITEPVAMTVEDREGEVQHLFKVEQDFVICPDPEHFGDLDPFHFVPPTSAGLFFPIQDHIRNMS